MPSFKSVLRSLVLLTAASFGVPAAFSAQCYEVQIHEFIYAPDPDCRITNQHIVRSTLFGVSFLGDDPSYNPEDVCFVLKDPRALGKKGDPSKKQFSVPVTIRRPDGSEVELEISGFSGIRDERDSVDFVATGAEASGRLSAATVTTISPVYDTVSVATLVTSDNLFIDDEVIETESYGAYLSLAWGSGAFRNATGYLEEVEVEVDGAANAADVVPVTAQGRICGPAIEKLFNLHGPQSP